MTVGLPDSTIRRLARSAAAWALLTTALSASLVQHNHSLFLRGDEASRTESRYLTRHNPLSGAVHWHAVLAVVHENNCIACHNQRLTGILSQHHDRGPSVSKQARIAARPAGILTTSLLPSGSRAPPVLL